MAGLTPLIRRTQTHLPPAFAVGSFKVSPVVDLADVKAHLALVSFALPLYLHSQKPATAQRARACSPGSPVTDDP